MDDSGSQPGAFAEGPLDDTGSQPGAFAEGPVNCLGFNDTSWTDPTHDETMVEARIVDDVEICQAQPVDLEAQERQKEKHRWTRRYQTGFALTAFLAIGAVIIVVALLKAENSADTAGTLSAANAVSVRPAVSPAAPTTFEALRAQLPNYTLESLKDPHSPQTSALHWLVEHQNITTLPLWRQQQVFALTCLYYSFDGPTWPLVGEDWLDDSKSECDWFSSYFGSWDVDTYVESKKKITSPCTEDGRFQALYLVNTGGFGFFLENVFMPPELSLLSSLETIWLDNHDLRNVSLLDMLPTQIVSLKNLENIHVGSSQLLGNIPSHLGLLTGLTSLSLADNHLTGTIPEELGPLVSRYNLSALDLRGNLELIGSIPGDLCMLGSYLNDTFSAGFAFDCATHSGALCGCGCPCAHD